MDALQTLNVTSWQGPFGEAERRDAIAALESGHVLFFPQLPFVLREEERPLLTPELSSGRAKNISLDPSGKLKHESGSAEERALLQGMMERFATGAASLVSGLFPDYAEKLERARTSYRPVRDRGPQIFAGP